MQGNAKFISENLPKSITENLNYLSQTAFESRGNYNSITESTNRNAAVLSTQVFLLSNV